MRLTFAGCVLLGLGGCASGYEEFYQQAPGATAQVVGSARAAPPPVEPQVLRAAPSDPQQMTLDLLKRGFSLIGYSAFNSGAAESEADAIRQAKKVGADLVVIVNPTYTGTITSQIPITTPTTQTSYTMGTATAYGPGGSVTAYGNATTTTHGSQTNYIPMSTNRHDYSAGFFIKQKFALGAYARDLNDDERRQLQTNQGAVLYVIVDGSPAFFADLLPGDVVTSLGGTPTHNQEAFVAAAMANAGKEIEISLIREGDPLAKRVKLNPL